ncbi:MAG: inorganic phosphate transporter, partial [Bacteroides sp.]|nr:inorganic phosphate transporter [Bacteroides sp.]
QILYWLKVNVFKVIVLMGTFALAMAFAGNDLVNFIGVPLAGYSSFTDFVANGGGDPNSLLMTSLLGPAKTPWYFLFGAGAIIVYALCTSKKAHNIIKTSVNLSRQDEGEESFGSTQIARTLVRISMGFAGGIVKVVPDSTKRWIETRFRKNEAIMEEGAAFDLVRASVNLVLAELLIAVGTSMKLPLSATYVTFMVAMGTSLADRAWGRDSAVFRITGVLSVIGGWFITAGAAFTICFFVALVLYYGGSAAVVVMIALAVLSLIRSQVMYKKKSNKEGVSDSWKNIIDNTDETKTLELIRIFTQEELTKVLDYAGENYDLAVESFMKENLRGLRRAAGATKFEKQLIKQMKRQSTLAVSKLDNNVLLDRGLYFYQGNDFAGEIVYSIGCLIEPCLEHIDNNFNPLNDTQKKEFTEVSKHVSYLLSSIRTMIAYNRYDNYQEIIDISNKVNSQLSQLNREELKRIQENAGSIKVSMVYLTMLQEAQNVVNYSVNLLKVARRFQQN